MGARIKVEGRVAVVEGVPALHSAQVRCTDLRGGAALCIAALAAAGGQSGQRHRTHRTGLRTVGRTPI